MASERLFEEMTKVVISGLPDRARELATEALRIEVDPLEAIEQGFKPGMDVVGEGFAKGELFIPDLMMSGEAMKSAIATLEPELMKRKQQRQVLGRVVIGTVQGDIHEIGKTLVSTMLGASGWAWQLNQNVLGGPLRSGGKSFGSSGFASSAQLSTGLQTRS